MLSRPIPAQCVRKIIGKLRRSVPLLPERGTVGHTLRAAIVESGDSPASTPVGADDLPLSPLSAAILKRVNHLSSQKDYLIRLDRWWIRVHVRPRRALFTPLLTANGPQCADQIHPRRRTVCIDSNDQAHIFNAQWRSYE